MNESLFTLWCICMFFNVMIFIAGALIAIFIKVDRKKGIKMMIYSLIAFLIGFGGCVVYLSINPMRIM